MTYKKLYNQFKNSYSFDELEEFRKNGLDVYNMIESEIYHNELGKRIIKYCDKYKGLPYYNDILLAVQFGGHIDKEVEEYIENLKRKDFD